MTRVGARETIGNGEGVSGDGVGTKEVGNNVGESVCDGDDTVGVRVGTEVGVRDGTELGVRVGTEVGIRVGSKVGALVAGDGINEGASVMRGKGTGMNVGSAVGDGSGATGPTGIEGVGTNVGTNDGIGIGDVKDDGNGTKISVVGKGDVEIGVGSVVCDGTDVGSGIVEGGSVVWGGMAVDTGKDVVPGAGMEVGGDDDGAIVGVGTGRAVVTTGGDDDGASVDVGTETTNNKSNAFQSINNFTITREWMERAGRDLTGGNGCGSQLQLSKS